MALLLQKKKTIAIASMAKEVFKMIPLNFSFSKCEKNKLRDTKPYQGNKNDPITCKNCLGIIRVYKQINRLDICPRRLSVKR